MKEILYSRETEKVEEDDIETGEMRKDDQSDIRTFQIVNLMPKSTGYLAPLILKSHTSNLFYPFLLKILVYINVRTAKLFLHLDARRIGQIFRSYAARQALF